MKAVILPPRDVLSVYSAHTKYMTQNMARTEHSTSDSSSAKNRHKQKEVLKMWDIEGFAFFFSFRSLFFWGGEYNWIFFWYRIQNEQQNWPRAVWLSLPFLSHPWMYPNITFWTRCTWSYSRSFRCMFSKKEPLASQGGITRYRNHFVKLCRVYSVTFKFICYNTRSHRALIPWKILCSSSLLLIILYLFRLSQLWPELTISMLVLMCLQFRKARNCS